MLISTIVSSLRGIPDDNLEQESVDKFERNRETLCLVRRVNSWFA